MFAIRIMPVERVELVPICAYRPRHGACDDAVKNVGIERKQTLCDVDGSSFGE